MGKAAGSDEAENLYRTEAVLGEQMDSVETV
jgi:hypothetical protein